MHSVHILVFIYLSRILFSMHQKFVKFSLLFQEFPKHFSRFLCIYALNVSPNFNAHKLTFHSNSTTYYIIVIMNALKYTVTVFLPSLALLIPFLPFANNGKCSQPFQIFPDFFSNIGIKGVLFLWVIMAEKWSCTNWAVLLPTAQLYVKVNIY